MSAKSRAQWPPGYLCFLWRLDHWNAQRQMSLAVTAPAATITGQSLCRESATTNCREVGVTNKRKGEFENKRGGNTIGYTGFADFMTTRCIFGRLYKPAIEENPRRCTIRCRAANMTSPPGAFIFEKTKNGSKKSLFHSSHLPNFA